MIRRGPLLLPLVLALLLAACSTPAPIPIAAPPPVAEKPVKMHEAGLDRVMGKSRAQLVALFGDADLDGHEGQAQRLQFVGPACVLDAYLIPAKAGGDPVVSYVDARTPSGEDMDRASCIASLSRRASAP